VLFRELERRACKIVEDRNRGDVLTVRMGWDEVGFTVSEAIRQIRRRLTAEEKARDPGSRQVWTQTREPTGELVLKFSGAMPTGIPHAWQDQPERPLETQLAEALAGILTALAYVRKERERHTAEERRRHEREEEERRREAERQVELNRKLGLRQRADAWQVAAQIRSYVAAVLDAAGKGNIAEEPAALEEWSRWALAHADEFDPLQAGTALGTDLLWEEDRTVEERFGQRIPGRLSGDPNWFWGRRWWLKG